MTASHPTITHPGDPVSLRGRLRDPHSGPGRFLRYAGVSIVAFLLAQAGLALGYGVLHWNVPASVILSLAVSVGPAYVLNRRHVWPRTGDAGSLAVEINGFAAIAVVGSVTTIGVVALAETVARAFTSSHLILSVVVNAASIVATAAVWVLRYVVLDRFLFRDRNAASTVPEGTVDVPTKGRTAS